MKSISHLVLLIFCTLYFFSCKEDTVGPSGDANYYNWAVLPVAMDSVYRITAANDNVAYIAGNSTYKVTDSNVTRINFQDSTFHCSGVDAFDKNNVVFWGGTNGMPGITFKIYNDGIFSTFNSALTIYPNYKTIFINKNKFYYSSFDGYALFDNGVVTELPVPPSESVRGMAKISESVYLFTSTSSAFQEDRVYRLVNNSPLLITSSPSQGRLYPLNNDMLRVIQDSTNHILQYYSGANWENLFSYTSDANTNFISYIAGDSRAQFLSIWFAPNSVANCDVYSANVKYTQTNFPSYAITPPALLMVRTVSNYSDNTYYVIDKHNATKLLRGKLK